MRLKTYQSVLRVPHVARADGSVISNQNDPLLCQPTHESAERY